MTDDIVQLRVSRSVVETLLFNSEVWTAFVTALDAQEGAPDA